MPLPSGVKVELEFTAGVWTDVTADVDYGPGISIHVGRTSPQSQPQVGSATVTLNNSTGKYTPGVAVLSDGSAAPYYPNVDVRKRMRISNSSGVRFLGQVKSWQPTTNGFAGSSQCVVSASDLMDALSRVDLQSGMRQEITADSPSYYWPLTDAAGSTQATEYGGKLNLPVAGQASGALTFGDNGPGAGDGTGVKFTPTAFNSGQLLDQAFSSAIPLPLSFELWFNKTANASWIGTNAEFLCELGAFILTLSTAGLDATYSGSIDGPVTSYADGQWHQVVYTATSSTVNFYIDNVLVATGAGPGAITPTGVRMRVGDAFSFGPGRFLGNIGQVAIYPSALSTARIAAHYAAGKGYYGETVDQRIGRFLGYAGIDPADYSLQSSSVVLGTYSQDGKDVLAAIQDITPTEGGGAVFYMAGSTLVFESRGYRDNTPDLTVTIGADDDAAGYQPSLDDQSLVNQVTVDRASESGSQTTQTASDATSIATYGLAASTVTSYTTSDDDALYLAQSIVAAGKTPGWRLPKITVDLLTAQHNLYASLQNVGIGSRLRVTGLPAGQAPSTQVDLYVEGWTETINVGAYTVAFDTSPADNPAFGYYDTDRYQAEDDCALSASLTNAATSLSIACPTAPTFTTDPTDYPLTIQVDAEQIQLNSAPGGSTSPQTFTGVTRAVNGTTAAAHASGAQVEIAPTLTYAL